MTDADITIVATEAYITAYNQAAKAGLPPDDCTYVGRLAFEARLAIEAEKFKALLKQPPQAQAA